MSRDITLEDVTLAGRLVALRPMRAADVGDLATIALAGDLLRWFPFPPRSIRDVEAFVDAALAARATGTALPFVTTDAATGAVIGTTRFADIDRANRHVEIGWTFLMPSRQRSGANVEAKRLMLAHAFEVWGCGRVEFKTDSHNVASRRVLAALGAVEEGATTCSGATGPGGTACGSASSIRNGPRSAIGWTYGWPPSRHRRKRVRPALAAVARRFMLSHPIPAGARCRATRSIRSTPSPIDRSPAIRQRLCR